MSHPLESQKSESKSSETGPAGGNRAADDIDVAGVQTGAVSDAGKM